MDTRRTACNRDCPDACTLLVTVDGQGRATRLKGDPADPVTRGFLCERTSRFLDRQYAADRFTTPLLQGRPVSWDEALDVAGERLLHFRRQHGPESILHYRSGGSLGMLKTLADRLFEAFGPVSAKRGDICSGAGEAAQEMDFGLCDSHDLDDLLESRMIVVWGKNVHTSGPHLLPVLLEARRRGALLVAVDVVRTRIAERADRFFHVPPGGDFALALGAAHRLLQRGRLVPDWCDHREEYLALVRAAPVTEEARELGDLLAERSPANVQVGWGLARRTGGAAAVRALDALAALAGNLGVPGGGVSYYYRRRGAFAHLSEGRSARTFAEARLGAEILQADPPVRMIWVTAGNPVSMLPDSNTVRRAFEQAEFVVAVDTHPTDTTDCADLVLPTLTLLEDDDLLGVYGNHYLRASSPALASPGDTLPELAILQALAQRLGLAHAVEGTAEEWKRRLLQPVLDEVTLERLAQGPVKNPRASRILFAGGRFPTPTGRMNLVTEAPPPPPPVTADYPLTLLAVSTPKAQASQWAVPQGSAPEARVHPKATALDDGTRAWLESPHGRMPVTVVHDDAVHPEAVLVPKGGMARQGWCPNALVEARETDHGGGAAYYDQPVRLRAAEAPGSAGAAAREAPGRSG